MYVCMHTHAIRKTCSKVRTVLGAQTYMHSIRERNTHVHTRMQCVKCTYANSLKARDARAKPIIYIHFFFIAFIYLFIFYFWKPISYRRAFVCLNVCVFELVYPHTMLWTHFSIIFIYQTEARYEMTLSVSCVVNRNPPITR